MSPASSLHDQDKSFGWISIGLHWFATGAIVLMWFIGQSIASLPVQELEARRSLHITLGLIVWLPLLVRILWRFKSHHPHIEGQSLLTHRLAKMAHYTMLVVLGILLLSGPLMAWAIPENSSLIEVAFALHSNAAKALAVIVVLHVFAALKHLMFHDDETIARMFVPRSEGSDVGAD